MIQQCTIEKSAKKNKTKPLFIRAVFIMFMVYVFSTAGIVVAQEHDLFVSDVIPYSDPLLWQSPDIKLGTDFDYSITGAYDDNVVWWDSSNKIYGRFHINGFFDHLLTIPQINQTVIRFHYRTDVTAGPIPPGMISSDLSGWTLIGDLSVNYAAGDAPFASGTIWPDPILFTSVGDNDRYFTWNAPGGSDYYLIRSEVIGHPGYVDNVPGNNVTVSLYPGMALRDIDVVILVDVSGSMGGYYYNGYNYMEQAKARVAPFVAALNEDHKVAVVAFSTYYPNGWSDIWPTPVASLQPATSTNKDDIILAINALNDGGGTPLGSGIERAIDILSSGDPSRKRTILILSDGEENSGSPLACFGSDPAAPCASQTLVSQLQTNNIRVFSVALGTAAWEECLECLADETEGQWYGSVSPGIDLGEVCLQMQQVVSADDLYRVDKGTSGGGNDTYQVAFEGADDVMYFILEWEDLKAELNLELRNPGSATWLSNSELDNAKIFGGKGYQVIRISNPQAGQWRYRVVGTADKKYMAAVRTDRVNTRLTMDAQSSGVVGQPIHITARMTTKGKPVYDARLIAEITIPVTASLDTVLRNSSRDYIKQYNSFPIDSALLTNTSLNMKSLNTTSLNSTMLNNRNSIDMSPRGAFIKKISEGKPETLIKTRTITVPLEHKGKGQYLGVLSGKYTQIAGKYTVTVKSKNSEFQRNVSKQIRMKPGKIDFKKSFAEILQVKPKDVPPIWLLRSYPTDKFGNAITTPSLIHEMKVSLKRADMAGAFKIGFDSAFQQQLKVSPRKKPALKSLKIGDNKFQVKGRHGKKAWKYGIGGIFALIIVIIAL